MYRQVGVGHLASPKVYLLVNFFEKQVHNVVICIFLVFTWTPIGKILKIFLSENRWTRPLIFSM